MDLEKILENHKKWLNDEGGERADLCRANLRFANLRFANLSGANLRFANLSDADLCRANLRFADLRDANLSGANLRGANLRDANLSGANLRFANLRDADLRRANLRGANLRGADLSDADLRDANLSDANLRDANLSGADLRGANLRGADLRGADLRDANLSDADLRDAKWDIYTAFYPLQCPETGAFVGWKKAGGKIVKLEILADAKRSSATSRKCRCSAAKVLEIQNIDGSLADAQEIASDYDSKFVYRVGEVVSVDNFDDDRWKECAPGIHFFITREEAVKYC